jgi:hypothetical protein
MSNIPKLPSLNGNTPITITKCQFMTTQGKENSKQIHT